MHARVEYASLLSAAVVTNPWRRFEGSLWNNYYKRAGGETKDIYDGFQADYSCGPGFTSLAGILDGAVNSLSSPQNPYKYAIIKHSIFYSQEAVVVIVGVLIYKASYCDNNVNSDALGWRGVGGGGGE